MPRVIVIQHVGVEGLGRLAPALARAGLDVELVAPDAPLADLVLGDARGLVVLGGPMGVDEVDAYPRLRDELRLLADALRTDVPVLGICLGSQLLAHALGAPVTRGPARELGWFEVSTEPGADDDPLFAALPARFGALHCHGDVFELSAGATPLARTALTAHQAFRHGRAWGVLFHLEIDEPQLRAMAITFADELRGEGLDPDALVEDVLRHDPEAAAQARTLFDAWAAVVVAPAA